MSTTVPIKDKEALDTFRNFYLKEGDYRNYALIVTGLNTALRIGDILSLKWENVYNFSNNVFLKHIDLIEHKTRRNSSIAMNNAIISALELLMEHLDKQELMPQRHIFTGQKNPNAPISRSQAFRIVKKAAKAAGMNHNVSCHSLRKTFGYYAYKSVTSSVMLMNIYNHSSFQVTKRYLGVDQDERDAVFLSTEL